MLRSNPGLELRNGEPVTIVVDDQTLEWIEEDVRANKKAMVALAEYDLAVKTGLDRRDLPSPTPPDDFLEIYKIMNKYDERYAAVMGNKVIAHLLNVIFRNGEYLS